MKTIPTTMALLAAFLTISTGGRASNDLEVAQIPIGSVCVTIKGTCSLTRPIPIGYPCTCDGFGDLGGTPGTTH